MAQDHVFYPHAVNLFSDVDLCTDLDDKLGPLLSSSAHGKILFWSVEMLEEALIQRLVRWQTERGIGSRIVWWLQPSHAYSENVLRSIGENLYLIDSDLLLLQMQTKQAQPNPSWIPNTGKFLFLTGKPDRPNRIRLLWKFSRQDLLSQCEWSLFVDADTMGTSRGLLPELSDTEFDAFVAQHNRTADHVEILHSAGSIHCSGYPFNAELYQCSSFRVISETMMFSRPITSEKTWITLINRVPFIMAGYSNSLGYLTNAGYRTFNDYLAVPHYDDIADQEQRLDAIVTNTKFWSKYIIKYKDQIETDIEHNYHLLCAHMQKNYRMAKKLASALDDPKRSPALIVPLSMEQHRWCLFYYRIKDSSWPDCFIEQNFVNLPTRIQDELVQVFGYQPKNQSGEKICQMS